MRSFLSEKRSVFKMVIVLIAPASVLSISITCFIVREVISRHDDEMVKVIAAEINDDIGNELLKAVMVSRGMANDTFMHPIVINSDTVEDANVRFASLPSNITVRR